VCLDQYIVLSLEVCHYLRHVGTVWKSFKTSDGSFISTRLFAFAKAIEDDTNKDKKIPHVSTCGCAATGAWNGLLMLHCLSKEMPGKILDSILDL
jgi:hypothetical protein